MNRGKIKHILLKENQQKLFRFMGYDVKIVFKNNSKSKRKK